MPNGLGARVKIYRPVVQSRDVLLSSQRQIKNYGTLRNPEIAVQRADASLRSRLPDVSKGRVCVGAAWAPILEDSRPRGWAAGRLRDKESSADHYSGKGIQLGNDEATPPRWEVAVAAGEGSTCHDCMRGTPERACTMLLRCARAAGPRW